MHNLIDIKGTTPGALFEKVFDYRIEEDTIFDDTIWFFGCSHVYGYGLPRNKTAPSILGTILDETVVNLGVPKSGIDLILENLTRLLSLHKPKAVVIAYPMIARKMFLTKKGLILFTPMHLQQDISDRYKADIRIFKFEFVKYLLLVKTGKVILENMDNINKIRAMLADNHIPLVEFTYIGQPELNDVHSFTGPSKWLDLAQDGLHPGFKTQTAVVEWVREHLQLKKIVI
jgi:hypothetical protein